MSHYVKTAQGRAEIASRSGKVPRTARNLLLIVDSTRPASQWAALIQGATQADIDYLLANGMIEPHAQAPARDAVPQTIEAALQSLDYDQLYHLLTSQAKERLGLFKGFRLVLEVEKCSDAHELRALAIRFVDMVRQAQGDRVARGMTRALGVSGLQMSPQG